jgi:MYXO-CTERM domain-containing protein
MKRCLSIGVVLVLVLFPLAGLANSPAPWWACEGRVVGDSCDPYGGGDGVCELDAECEDDEGTEVNECLWCDELPGEGGCATAGASAGALGLVGLGLLLALRRKG